MISSQPQRPTSTNLTIKIKWVTTDKYVHKPPLSVEEAHVHGPTVEKEKEKN
uniref:Uncharacterized protein n=1 Tax=Setaria italica TaxID=4555 RepID=K3XQ66_SETIT